MARSGREGQAIQINSGGGGGAGASSSRPWSPISGGLDRRPPLSVSVGPEEGRRAVAPANYEDDDDDNVLSSTQQVTWKEDIEEEAPARRRVPPPSSGQPVLRCAQGGGSGKTGRAAAGKGTRGRKVASGSLRQKSNAPVRAQSKKEQRQRCNPQPPLIPPPPPAPLSTFICPEVFLLPLSCRAHPLGKSRYTESPG